jgi:phosphoribosylanthranilate isomerase
MFKIKICGITNVEDARVAIDAGADAIGLNFYENSPRFVTPSDATAICACLNGLATIGRRDITAYGVFVNKQADEVLSLIELGIRGIQLHGDETPTDVAAFKDWPPHWKLIRARRFDDRGVAALAADLHACIEAGRRPDALLVDALTPGRYGGTGETVSWVGLADHNNWLRGTPLILAGGLTPDNVAEAIRSVRPHGVDVASGVESAPGKKDPAKICDFVAAARAAFAAIEPRN